MEEQEHVVREEELRGLARKVITIKSKGRDISGKVYYDSAQREYYFTYTIKFKGEIIRISSPLIQSGSTMFRGEDGKYFFVCR